MKVSNSDYLFKGVIHPRLKLVTDEMRQERKNPD